MPINKNEELKNRHLMAMGFTGSGKTHFINHHPLVDPKSKERIRLVAWDPYGTYDVNHFTSVNQFIKNLSQAIKSNKYFRIGLEVDPSIEAFEKFCRAVWVAADGNNPIAVLIGELADVSNSGKPSDYFGKMIRVGRKYGIILLVETQRPQDITKTVFTQTSAKWVGYFEPYDHAYVERNVGLEKGSLTKIKFESYHCFYKVGSDIQYGTPQKKVKI